MSANHIICPLGPLDSFSAARHALGFMNSVVVTYRYVFPAELAGPGNADKLKTAFLHAVARTVEKHTPLQVGIDDEDSTTPSWKRLDALQLGRHIRWLSPGPRGAAEHEELLRGELEAQHNTRFPGLARQPGWRLVNLPSHGWDFVDAMFAWNHAYTDATGGTIFHGALLENFSTAHTVGPTALQDDGALALPRDPVLPPTLHEAVRFTFSVPFIVKTVWAELLCPWFLAAGPPEHPPWAGGPPITKPPCKTSLRLAELDNSLLQTVLQACRANRTTLTGLVHALVLTSLARSVTASEARAFVYGTPISLRRYFKSPPCSESHHAARVDPNGILGNYSTSTKHLFGPEVVDRLRSHDDRADDMVWDIARKVKGELTADVRRLPAEDSLGLMHLVRDWKAYLRNQAAKPRERAWAVSNLGAVDAMVDGGEAAESRTSKTPNQGQTARWRVERAIFSQGAQVADSAFAVNVLAVKGGKLVIACSWHDEGTTAKTGPKLVSDLQSWLNALGRRGSLSISGRNQDPEALLYTRA